MITCVNIFEARNSKELLFSIIFALSDKDSNVLIINLTNVKVSSYFLGIRIINLNYSSFVDKFYYQFFFTKKNKFNLCNNVFLFHEFSPLTKVNQIQNISLIEHGIINYYEQSAIYQSMSFLSKLINKIFIGSICGRCDKIKNIYLTFADASPTDISNKVYSLEIEEKWLQLSESEKSEINTLFGYEKLVADKVSLILTQPIELFNDLNETIKIDIYKKLYSCFNLTEKTLLVIKPHPIEKTKYNKIFKSSKVLNGSYPAELIVLNDRKKLFQVSTLFSTSIFPFIGKAEVIWKGAWNHPLLIKHFDEKSLPEKLLNKIKSTY